MYKKFELCLIVQNLTKLHVCKRKFLYRFCSVTAMSAYRCVTVAAVWSGVGH